MHFKNIKEANKFIASRIIAAQMCSDNGKWLTSFADELEKSYKVSTLYDSCGGYRHKVDYIVSAINAINCVNQWTHGKCQFKYYCERDTDQNGYLSLVTYFETYNHKSQKWLQISFHTPWREVKKHNLSHLDGKGSFTVWNCERGGSRAAAYDLAEMYLSWK